MKRRSASAVLQERVRKLDETEMRDSSSLEHVTRVGCVGHVIVISPA